MADRCLPVLQGLEGRLPRVGVKTHPKIFNGLGRALVMAQPAGRVEAAFHFLAGYIERKGDRNVVRHVKAPEVSSPLPLPIHDQGGRPSVGRVSDRVGKQKNPIRDVSVDPIDPRRAGERGVPVEKEMSVRRLVHLPKLGVGQEPVPIPPMRTLEQDGGRVPRGGVLNTVDHVEITDKKQQVGAPKFPNPTN